MKCAILGDIHGYWIDTNLTIANALREHPDITHIIQVGDFGYGWSHIKPMAFDRRYLEDSEIKRLENEIELLYIDGNHENFDRLEQDQGAWQPFWRHVPRGRVLDIGGYRCLFQGGATSADKHQRTPHISWWPQENIEYGQIQRALNEIDQPIHAIFSHDHPASFPYSKDRYDNDIIGGKDKMLLDKLFDYFKPEFWFFGHHHYKEHNRTKGTEWFCCPVIESQQYVIWTGTSAFGSWE